MNPVLFDLGFIKIYWYSIMIFAALLIGGWLVLKEAKRFNIPEDFVTNLFFFAVPISILGARLYYVVFNWSYYSAHLVEIFKVWEGGLAIHGGLLFGLLWVIIYTKKYKVPTLKMLDMIVVGLIIGQAIGRWGNFVNQEVYGQVVTNPSLQFFPFAVKIGETYFEALFFYEFVLNLIGFAGLSVLFLKEKSSGYCVGGYLMYYGIVRTILEPRRNAMYILKASTIKVSLVCSILMIVVGAAIIAMLIIKNIKNKGIKNGKTV